MQWDIPYEKGEIIAVAYMGNEEQEKDIEPQVFLHQYILKVTVKICFLMEWIRHKLVRLFVMMQEIWFLMEIIQFTSRLMEISRF